MMAGVTYRGTNPGEYQNRVRQEIKISNPQEGAREGTIAGGVLGLGYYKKKKRTPRLKFRKQIKTNLKFLAKTFNQRQKLLARIKMVKNQPKSIPINQNPARTPKA